ncbi:MAG: baeS [Cyanobacteria bacterium RYN_339]|nr:baeS [Cyanobacteria bacterium RYN_339]
MARILIVEDEPAVAEVASLVCRRDGHEVAVTRSAAAALEALRLEAFDLVLTDVAMEGMDGIQLAAEIRGIVGLEGLPIIGVTALATPTERAEMEAAGIDAVIAKPYSGRALAAAIAELLSTGR